MELNPIGPIGAVSAFLGIWLGHVGVRQIERRATRLWPPVILFTLLGLALEVCALMVTERTVSTACGILGITVLWDALETIRQEKRVCRGHAPANPDNPRHAQILAQFPQATTLDLLAREPIGRRVDAREAIRLARENRT